MPDEKTNMPDVIYATLDGCSPSGVTLSPRPTATTSRPYIQCPLDDPADAVVVSKLHQGLTRGIVNTLKGKDARIAELEEEVKRMQSVVEDHKRRSRTVRNNANKKYKQLAALQSENERLLAIDRHAGATIKALEEQLQAAIGDRETMRSAWNDDVEKRDERIEELEAIVSQALPVVKYASRHYIHTNTNNERLIADMEAAKGNSHD